MACLVFSQKNRRSTRWISLAFGPFSYRSLCPFCSLLSVFGRVYGLVLLRMDFGSLFSPLVYMLIIASLLDLSSGHHAHLTFYWTCASVCICYRACYGLSDFQYDLIYDYGLLIGIRLD